MSAFDEVHKLLDQASDKFHQIRKSVNDSDGNEMSRDRAEQFDSHMSTVKDAVDWAAANQEASGVATAASSPSPAPPAVGDSGPDSGGNQ